MAAAGGPGPAAVLATTRLHDLGPALATYLPALAADRSSSHRRCWSSSASTDPLSAAAGRGHAAAGAAVHGAGRQLHPRTATADSARALDRIAAHVAELVRGLPVLVGLGRAADQPAALAAARRGAPPPHAGHPADRLPVRAGPRADRHAVGRAGRGDRRRCGWSTGTSVWPSACTALLLAPEAFAPLRALGSAHHAAEDAALAAAEARAVLAAARPSAGAGSCGRRPAGCATSRSTGLTVRYPGRAVPGAAPVDLAVRPGRAGRAARCQRLGQVDAARGARRADRTRRGRRRHGHRRSGRRRRVRAAVPAHDRRDAWPTSCAGTPGSEPGPDAGVGEAFVVEALARVGAPQLAGRAPESLSPGELQRVALARALVRIRRGARLLLLDEPTAHLDDDARAAGRRRPARACAARSRTLLVTHDPALAALADRTVDPPRPDGSCENRRSGGRTRPRPHDGSAANCRSHGEAGAGGAREGGAGGRAVVGPASR